MLKPNQTKDTGIIQEDLEKRKQLVFNRARGDVAMEQNLERMFI